MRVSGGHAQRAERLPLLVERATSPAISPDGQRLAFSQISGQDHIMRIELSEPGEAQGIPTRFASSTRSEMWPEYSQDGERIAFLSDRSGTFDIWTCGADGSNLLKITSYTGTFGSSLIWCPKGEHIAFPSIRDGAWNIVVINAQSGNFKCLTTGLTPFGWPSELTIGWSSDGKWIHFSSDSWNASR